MDNAWTVKQLSFSAAAMICLHQEDPRAIMGLWLLLTRKFLSFVSIFSEQFHLQLVTILEQLEKKGLQA